MSKFLYLIKKLEIMPWIKYYLLKRQASPSYPLSEITTGTSPLTLSNSVRKKFNIFNIGGNTIQDGTPTPEAPIPVENVSGEVEVKVANGTDSTATGYEEQTATFPLAEGQALHLGDTLEDDGIHQKRNARIFDSSASIIYSSTNLAFSIMMPSNYNNRGIIFCNKYKYNNTVGNASQLSNYECTGLGGNGKYFHLKDNRFSTNTEFKNYIIEQYEAGTPLIVEYELATPVVIPYTAEQQTAYNALKNLYSYKGTTYISSSNEPSPIFEVQYYMEGE